MSFVGWGIFGVVMVGAAGLADEASRTRSAQMPGWMYIGLGLIIGSILGGGAAIILMRKVMISRRNEASRRATRAAELEREALRTRRQAREAALRAYPDYLDDDTLRDPEGTYAWPDYLFSKLFVVPDIVVPYHHSSSMERSGFGRRSLWPSSVVTQSTWNIGRKWNTNVAHEMKSFDAKRERRRRRAPSRMQSVQKQNPSPRGGRGRS